MKKLILITIIAFNICSYAQRSNYYTVDVNQKINTNENINVSGKVNINKTITSIDYGALALANAQSEKNQIELKKITDEKERAISLEIAEDPIKAYDYGFQNVQEEDKKIAKELGFKGYSISYVIPHKSLFVSSGVGRYENVSKDGIITEILIYGPLYNKEKLSINLEKELSYEDVKVGEESEQIDDDSIVKKFFCHKKDLNRATVYGVKGYKGTIIYEDKFENVISDNYQSFNTEKGNGFENFVKVRYYGDKDNITFEQLEGRRFYLTPLIEKVISTAVIFNIKI